MSLKNRRLEGPPKPKNICEHFSLKASSSYWGDHLLRFISVGPDNGVNHPIIEARPSEDFEELSAQDDDDDVDVVVVVVVVDLIVVVVVASNRSDKILLLLMLTKFFEKKMKNWFLAKSFKILNGPIFISVLT